MTLNGLFYSTMIFIQGVHIEVSAIQVTKEKRPAMDHDNLQ
jgi:hypothetical protein